MNRLVAILLMGPLIFLDWLAVESFLQIGLTAKSISFHLIAVLLGWLILARWLPGSRVARERWIAAGLLGPVMLLVPVLGMGLALAFLLSTGEGAGENLLRDRYRSLHELRENTNLVSQSYGANLLSIAEIMRAGDPVERRNATLGLRNIAPVESLPILRRLSQDDDELVRLFALSERRLIVNRFEARSRELAVKRRLKTATVEDLMRLAESYIEEVEVGLPSSQRQREALLERAEDVLLEARRMDSSPPDIEFSILRCALLRFDTEAAERAFLKLRGVVGREDRFVLPECEFYLQTADWPRLVDRLSKLPDSICNTPAMERVIGLWEPLLRREKPAVG